MNKAALTLAIAMMATSAFAEPPSIDMKALAQCEAFATSEETSPPEAESVCLGPANQGLPSAQYALGAILLSHKKYPEGLQWLEKAAQTHHPPSSHLLAEIYLQADDADMQARGKELLRYALCSGYPPAQASEHKGVLGASPSCPEARAASFDGTWTAEVSWMKAPPAGGAADELQVVIASGIPKVYLRANDKWVEAKPGEFRAQQVDETLVVSTVDSGWDLDGKWIESWTIHLLRLAPDSAVMNFVRTVNNVHVPDSFGFKTFSTVAEGKATRSSS